MKENWRTIVSIVLVVALAFVLTPFAGIGLNLLGVGVVGGSSATAAGALIGGISGTFNSAINGGGLNDILKGAVVGAIQGGLTAGLLKGMEPSSFGLDKVFTMESMKHVAGHGIVGGLSSEALGGKFQDGFFSAASAAFAGNAGAFEQFGTPGDDSGFGGVAARTAAAGVVGGTAAVQRK